MAPFDDSGLGGEGQRGEKQAPSDTKNHVSTRCHRPDPLKAPSQDPPDRGDSGTKTECVGAANVVAGAVNPQIF